MDTVVAVHRAASAFAIVLTAAALLAPDHPEVAFFLAATRAAPWELASVLLMIALAVPERR